MKNAIKTARASKGLTKSYLQRFCLAGPSVFVDQLKETMKTLGVVSALVLTMIGPMVLTLPDGLEDEPELRIAYVVLASLGTLCQVMAVVISTGVYFQAELIVDPNQADLVENFLIQDGALGYIPMPQFMFELGAVCFLGTVSIASYAVNEGAERFIFPVGAGLALVYMLFCYKNFIAGTRRKRLEDMFTERFPPTTTSNHVLPTHHQW